LRATDRRPLIQQPVVHTVGRLAPVENSIASGTTRMAPQYVGHFGGPSMTSIKMSMSGARRTDLR
jgi:hypothetical protein